MPTRSLAGAVLLLALLAVPGWAQTSDVPTVTRTVALENARIVPAPGQVIENGTLVMRDGLIVAVGPNVTVPTDAERIDASGMTLYAGFIDGLSHAGVPEPKSSRPQKPRYPGDPPNDRAGIQPERDVRTMLDPDDGSIEALRKQGFTVAQVVPHGRMFPGAAAVVLLGGETAADMVLKGDAGLFVQFASAQGVYPNTPMGMMAKFRQLYGEAERRRRMRNRYTENPDGLSRPPYDPVHAAFFPVQTRQRPVLYYTEDALETYQAMRLQSELNFPLVLAGVNQAYDSMTRLQATETPVFLTLDLPEASDDSTGTYDPARRTRTHADREEEKANLEARQQASRERYYGQAAQLHEAGIAFGFTTKETKPGDLHAHLRRYIEHGLPENAALAALTIRPAEILGLSRTLGTLAVGKIANVVVADGPLFDEDTQIRHVFVDGRQYDYSDSSSPKSADEADEPAQAVGTWAFTVASLQADVSGTLTLTGTPDALSGTITNPLDPEVTDLKEATLNGNRLTLKFDAKDYGTVTVKVQISGDRFEGTYEVPGRGTFPISGTRDD